MVPQKETPVVTADYTRILEASVVALLVGAAIVISSLFLNLQADLRAARSAAVRSDISNKLEQIRSDIDKAKSNTSGR